MSRANRLRQLEDASRVLYSRLMATTVHGSNLASRLAQLHDHYGSHDGSIPAPQGFGCEFYKRDKNHRKNRSIYLTGNGLFLFSTHSG